MLSCSFEEDVYEDETEDQIDVTDSSNIDIFLKKIRPIIQNCIKSYFSGKRLHDGRVIENRLLELPYYYELLLKTDMSSAVQKAYQLMEENNFCADKSETPDSVTDDMYYLIGVIKEVQKHSPPDYVGGLILMHLELIEGFEIW